MTPETRKLFAEMGKFNEELVKAGIMKSGDGLKPSSHGKRVAFDGPSRRVIDGPFAETKELVAGFWIWQVRSLEEAVEWAKRIPGTAIIPSDGTDGATEAGVIEIRPIFEDEDFATALLVDASDPDTLVVVSCGHPQPVLVSPDGSAAHVETIPCLPLGLGAQYEAVTVRWSAGQRLLMYTDGLSEARDRDGEFLPLLPLAPLLREGGGDEALDRLLDAVREHIPRGQLNDDLAVLLIEHLSDQVEPASWPAVRTLGLQLSDR